MWPNVALMAVAAGGRDDIHCTESTDKAAVILDLLIAHGAGIEERRWSGATPLYWLLAHRNDVGAQGCSQANARLLLERGADPLAKNYRQPFPPHNYRCGGFVVGKSTPSYLFDGNRHFSHAELELVSSHDGAFFTETDCYDDPLLASARIGDKLIFKLMLEAIDQTTIPFEKLKNRLSHAKAEAIENMQLQLLPILQDYYWRKVCVDNEAH